MEADPIFDIFADPAPDVVSPDVYESYKCRVARLGYAPVRLTCKQCEVHWSGALKSLCFLCEVEGVPLDSSRAKQKLNPFESLLF